MKLVSNANGKVTLKNSQGHSVVITSEPLKFEFLDKQGEVAVVINENSQLLVEPLKAKREKTVENDEDGQMPVDTVSVVFIILYGEMFNAYQLNLVIEMICLNTQYT